MPPGGKRPGAGRPKGSRSRTTRSKISRIEALIARGDELPLDFLLQLMRAPEPVQQVGESVLVFRARWVRWAEERFEAAKAAAPFCHPKLAAIEWRPPGSLTKDQHRAAWDRVPLEQRLELRDKIRALIDSYVNQPLPDSAGRGGTQPQ